MKSYSFILAAALAGAAYSANQSTSGLPGVRTTFSAYSLGQGSYDLGLTYRGEFGHNAIDEYTPGQGGRSHVYLHNFVPHAAFGVTNWLDLAASLPVYFDQIEGFEDDAVSIGDVEGFLKIMHPGLKPDAPIRLAYLMRATLPTGDFNKGWYARDPGYSYISRDNEGGAFSSGGYNLDPTLVWTLDLQRLKTPKRFLLHLNFGMDVLFYPIDKKNVPQENSALHGALALEFPATPYWSFFADFYGKTRMVSITGGDFHEIFAKDQLNLGIGARRLFESGLSAALGADVSVGTQKNYSTWKVFRAGETRQYGIQPTAIVGVTLTIGFGGVGRKADSDFDDNPNFTDKCPQNAEDYDGYRDEDGCPDPVHLAEEPIVHWDTVVVIKRDTVQIVKSDTVRITVPDTLQYQTAQDPNKIFGQGKTTFPNITFGTGSDNLNRSSFKTLNDIAQSLKNFPTVTLQVVGYTDNTGSDATNLTLSMKRAQSVVNYLVGQGVEGYRLEPIGKGSLDPVGTNKTGAGRLLNRRVEFKRVR